MHRCLLNIFRKSFVKVSLWKVALWCIVFKVSWHILLWKWVGGFHCYLKTEHSGENLLKNKLFSKILKNQYGSASISCQIVLNLIFLANLKMIIRTFWKEWNFQVWKFVAALNFFTELSSFWRWEIGMSQLTWTKNWFSEIIFYIACW